MSAVVPQNPITLISRVLQSGVGEGWVGGLGGSVHGLVGWPRRHALPPPLPTPLPPSPPPLPTPLPPSPPTHPPTNTCASSCQRWMPPWRPALLQTRRWTAAAQGGSPVCVCVWGGGGGLRATGARVCHRGVPRPGARRGGGRRARALAHTRAHARTHTHAPQSVGLRGRRLCSPPGRAPPPADAMPQTAPLQRAASSTLAGPQPLPARAPPPPALGAGVGGWANE